MNEIIKTSRVEVLDIEELNSDLKFLLEKSQGMTKKAFAPHSGFKVGAAGQLSNGEIALGNNQENDAYPSGMCAERVLVYHVGANYPEAKLQELFIAVDPEAKDSETFTPPCGACLQALIQLEKRQKSPIRVFIKSGKKVFKAESIETFLPFSFDL
jgi:cytidine deaminase